MVERKSYIESCNDYERDRAITINADMVEAAFASAIVAPSVVKRGGLETL